MKIFRYILTRSWVLLSLAALIVLFVTYQFSGIFRDSDFWFEIGTGETVITEVYGGGTRRHNEILVPPNVALGPNQTHSIEIDFRITWRPYEEAPLHAELEGQITFAKIDIFLRDSNGNPTDHYVPEYFDITMPDVAYITTNEEQVFTITIRLKQDLSSAQLQSIRGQHIGVTFSVNIVPITPGGGS